MDMGVCKRHFAPLLHFSDPRTGIRAPNLYFHPRLFGSDSQYGMHDILLGSPVGRILDTFEER
jgi:hypothetical protein